MGKLPKQMLLDNVTISKNSKGQLEVIPSTQGILIYQMLKNNSFLNGNSLFTDFFNSATGKNSTVDTTNSTALFNTDHFELPQLFISNFTVVNSTFDTPIYIYDNSATTYASDNSTSPVSSFSFIFSSPKYITSIPIHAVATGNGTNSSQSIQLEYTTDGTNWITITLASNLSVGLAATYNNTYIMNKFLLGVRLVMTADAWNTRTIYDFRPNEKLSSGIVISNVNMPILDGNESELYIYGDVSNTINTSVTCNVSDGVNVLSFQPLNSRIDMSSLNSSNLIVTFNLNSSNLSETPKFKGFGGVLL